MRDEERGTAERLRLERLRQRLYRPDASDEDRQRFAELAATSMRQDVEHVAAPRRAAPVADRRWRAPVLGAGAAVIVLAGLVVAIQAERPAATPFTARTDSSVADQQVVDADAVRPSQGSPTPSAIPTTLGGVETEVQRFEGTGTTVVAVDTRAAQQRNGTLLVMLTSTSRAQLGWFATRASNRSDRPGFAEIVAEGAPESGRQEVPAYGLHVYDGAPPNRLVVQAPEADRWTLTIGFLPRKNLPY